jgi:hypothetical protein
MTAFVANTISCTTQTATSIQSESARKGREREARKFLKYKDFPKGVEPKVSV